MADAKVDGAQAALDEIQARFPLHGIHIKVSSVDSRRWSIVFPDGRKVGLLAHFNKRRKAMRDWLRKWGPPLKAMGYGVTVSGTEELPVFMIIQKMPEDVENEAAQLEKEKSEKFADPNSRRSKRLRKRLEE
jgi:hypothetical protein